MMHGQTKIKQTTGVFHQGRITRDGSTVLVGITEFNLGVRCEVAMQEKFKRRHRLLPTEILSYPFSSIFIIVYTWLYILYASVLFCKLCIFILCLCILTVIYALFCAFRFIVLFCVLFVCKCVLYYCHRVTTQLVLTNISYHILSYHVISYHIRNGRNVWKMWKNAVWHCRCSSVI